MTEDSSLTPDQYRLIEQYVDKNGCSYDEARRRLGFATLNAVMLAPTMTNAVSGPLSVQGQELADMQYTGRASDQRKFVRQVSLASSRGEITEAEREILYSRRKV